MCGVCAPAGGLPRRCRLGGRQRYPVGGLPALSPACPATVVPVGGVPALSPAYTAFSFVFLPLSPRPPSRREGGDFLFSYARGCAPCIPGAEPARHWFTLPLWKTQWGACPGVAGAAGVSDTRRGACLLCRLPALPLRYPAGGVPALPPVNPVLTCFLAPIPPSPVGKGGTKVILCKGLRPLHPRG